MFKSRKILSFLLALCMLLSLIPIGSFATESGKNDFMMELYPAGIDGAQTRNGYLATPGFNVFLYSTNYDGGFGDQHCSDMELILHEKRVATNGCVNLLPTPEQWDVLPIPALSNRRVSQADQSMSSTLTWAHYNFSYTMVVTPEPGGVKVTVNLANPLPEELVGLAGFNLEFIPSVYKGKTYSMDDGAIEGVFPLSPEGPLADTPRPEKSVERQPIYVQEWNDMRGPYQPLPMDTAQRNITLAPEDSMSRVNVSSDSGPLMLYDGRMRSQNGWYVLRTMLPADKTDNAVVWHIKVDVEKDWIREPVIGHNQAGYTPDRNKVAVMELDRNDTDFAKEASVLRLNSDGTFTSVFTGPLDKNVRSYLRYRYVNFDFTEVKEPGMYVIEYAGVRTDLFPIAADAYKNIWQPSLDTWMTVQMDHMKVREGYLIHHAAGAEDDAQIGEANRSYFDAAGNIGNMDSRYETYEHISGINVGGWYDAGDFDNQMSREVAVTTDMAYAATLPNVRAWDQITVDWDAKETEIHRPDGIPDIVQHAWHGALGILSQVKVFGYINKVLEPSTLRSYTHLGDVADMTYGGRFYDRTKDQFVPLFYDSAVGASASDITADGRTGRKEGRSRWVFPMGMPTTNQHTVCASLAATAYVVKEYYPEYAAEALEYAVKLWEQYPNTHTSGTGDWAPAAWLYLATDGAEPYKTRVEAMLPSMLAQNQMANNGKLLTLLKPFMTEEQVETFRAAAKAYSDSVYNANLNNPTVGMPTTSGMWGGIDGVLNVGQRLGVLYRAFPDVVNPEYIYRTADYLLGTHPCSDTSWLNGIGTKSTTVAYGGSRAEQTYVRGGPIPGYVPLQPDFPECIDNFGFLWFETEAVINSAAMWIIAGSIVDEISSDVVESVKCDVSKIVAGRAANLPVSVTIKSGLEDASVSIALFAPDGTKLDSVNGLSGLFRVGKAVAGTYKFVAYVDGNETAKTASVVCEAEPVGLWAPVVALGESSFTVTFGAPITFNEAKKAVKIGDGAALDNALLSVSGAVLTASAKAVAGDKITISGVKYADLFPSYSFSFTVVAEGGVATGAWKLAKTIEAGKSYVIVSANSSKALTNSSVSSVPVGGGVSYSQRGLAATDVTVTGDYIVTPAEIPADMIWTFTTGTGHEHASVKYPNGFFITNTSPAGSGAGTYSLHRESSNAQPTSPLRTDNAFSGANHRAIWFFPNIDPVTGQTSAFCVSDNDESNVWAFALLGSADGFVGEGGNIISDPNLVATYQANAPLKLYEKVN